MAAGGAIDFARSGVDVALRRNDFPFDTRWHTREVTPERVGPVCRPDLADHGLDAMPWLHTRTRPDAWQRWARSAGYVLTGSTDVWYEHFYLSLQAASAGLGWAIASELMAYDELSDGRMAAPRGFVADGSAYHLLSPVPFEHDLRRLALFDWLHAEANASSQA